jgi:hypothetical protein
MTEYDNTNRGALFRNDGRKNDRQPEFTGSLNVNGVDYWLSAWVKVGKKGKFFSMAIKPKEEQSISERAQATIRKPDPISSGRAPMQKVNIIPDDDMNGDSIPF